ncbi:MAG: alpha/beta fold hydrolase [Fimbriimonadaceae bacterium]|nr:alpha/beta fold hydrolase [Fimbriimonadaceae bacterium]
MRFVTLLCLGAACLVASDDLPRRPWLGAALNPLDSARRAELKLAPGEGLAIGSPSKGGSAELAGLKGGEILLTVDGKRVGSVERFVELLAKKSSGRTLVLGLMKDGKRVPCEVRLVERPRDPGGAYEVLYDSVRSGDVRLRTIVTKPLEAGRLPAVLLIQGLGNSSVDAPLGAEQAYSLILNRFSEAGFVTMRVDKPGQGDSEGGPTADTDFLTELDGYRQGIKALKTYPFVDPDRVFVFGHSMGGIMGPILASETKLRGLIVMGTVVANWAEHMTHSTRRQMTLGEGDPAETEEYAVKTGRMYSLIYLEGKSPAEAKRAAPDLAPFIDREVAEGKYLHGRTFRFFRQLSRINLPSYWKKVGCDVLAAWGASDFVAERQEHPEIVRIVNLVRPGSAEYMELANTDHAFRTLPTQRESQLRWGRGPAAQFNREAISLLVRWAAERAKA